MGAVTIRFTGWQEEVIDELVKAGVVQTKAEALRLALFKLAADYNLVDAVTLLRVVQNERAKKNISMEEVLEGIESAKTKTIRR